MHAGRVSRVSGAFQEFQETSTHFKHISRGFKRWQEFQERFKSLKSIGRRSSFKMELKGVLHLMIACRAFEEFQGFQEFHAHFKSFKR